MQGMSGYDALVVGSPLHVLMPLTHLSTPGSRGGVLETTLEPGDLLIFANQSRAALYHTNPLLYHMNPPT